MRNIGLTPAQRSAFFRALNAACVELGHDTPEARESYRKQVMRDEAGVEHLAELSRTTGFDRCMARFAVDSCDYEAASRFAVAAVARQAALVRICCAQVLQLKGCEAGSSEAASYLSGICSQSGVLCGSDMFDQSFWMDIDPSALVTLFRMLDTHRRRLLRRLCAGIAGQTLAFSASVSYKLNPAGGVQLVYGSPDTSSDRIRVRVLSRQQRVTA